VTQLGFLLELESLYVLAREVTAEALAVAQDVEAN